MTECLPDTELDWPCATKKVGETKPVILSAFGICAQFWEANEQWDIGEYAWPTTACGFVAQCTTAGRSGSREPRFKTNDGAGTVFTDGSVTWTLQVPTIATGIQPISSPVAIPSDGMTVSGVVVIENTKLAVDYMGGTAGEKYTVLFTFNVAGRSRYRSQEVHVI